jgi:hypothetical protein
MYETPKVILRLAGRAPGRPKPARIPSGDRPLYSADEGLQ